MDAIVKRCATCGRTDTEFALSAKYRCKSCSKTYLAAYHARNKARQNQAAREYRTANREQLRAYDRERYRQNPQKYVQRTRQSRATNPEARRAWDKTYYEAHRESFRDADRLRRAREREAPHVEKIDSLYVYERDGWRCHICKKRVAKKDASIDHLVALARGGNHTYDNVALAHLSCNKRMNVGYMPAQLLLIG